eukprot:PhF_6_TR21669/c0_g2_i1/m.30923
MKSGRLSKNYLAFVFTSLAVLVIVIYNYATKEQGNTVTINEISPAEQAPIPFTQNIASPTEIPVPAVSVNVNNNKIANLTLLHSFGRESVLNIFVENQLRGECDTSKHATFAVELSGHVRQYEVTSAALKKNVLSPNPCAHVFAVTYENRGDRKSFMKESTPDLFTKEMVNVDHFIATFRPFLRMWVMKNQQQTLDEIRNVIQWQSALNVGAFRFYQWRMLELAHNLTKFDPTGVSWDFVMRARFDSYYFQPFHVTRENGLRLPGRDPFTCDPGFVVRMVEKAAWWRTNPTFRHEHCSDHFSFGKSSVMDKVLGLFSHFAFHPKILSYGIRGRGPRIKPVVFHTEHMTDVFLRSQNVEWCAYPPLNVLLRAAKSLDKSEVQKASVAKHKWASFSRTNVSESEIQSLLNL